MGVTKIPTRILFSRSRTFDSKIGIFEDAVVRELGHTAGVQVIVSPHLYDLPPNASLWSELATCEENLVVLSPLYPRATFWVMRAHGVDGRWIRTPSWPQEENLPDAEADSRTSGQSAFPFAKDPPEMSLRKIWCFDLRNFVTPEDLIGQLRQIIPVDGPSTFTSGAHLRGVKEAPGDGDNTGKVEPAFKTQAAHATRQQSLPLEDIELIRPRWYPVIDYSRCRNCLQCLNFCLFGVYRIDNLGRLRVSTPDACRDGCPACARLCPTKAIIFPMCPDPAIAGADGSGESPSRSPVIPLVPDEIILRIARPAPDKRKSTEPREGWASTEYVSTNPSVSSEPNSTREERNGSSYMPEDRPGIPKKSSGVAGGETGPNGASAPPPSEFYEVDRLLEEIDFGKD